MLDSQYKPAHCKTTLAFLAHFVAESRLTGDGATLTVMLWGLAQLLRILDEAGLWLTEEQTREAIAAGRTFLKAYQALSAQAQARNEANWKIRPKCHYVAHQIENLANRANPRLQSCFLDEDLMGRLKKVAAKCHHSTVVKRTLERWVVQLTLLWGEHA